MGVDGIAFGNLRLGHTSSRIRVVICQRDRMLFRADEMVRSETLRVVKNMNRGFPQNSGTSLKNVKSRIVSGIAMALVLTNMKMVLECVLSLRRTLGV